MPISLVTSQGPHLALWNTLSNPGVPETFAARKPNGPTQIPLVVSNLCQRKPTRSMVDGSASNLPIRLSDTCSFSSTTDGLSGLSIVMPWQGLESHSILFLFYTKRRDRWQGGLSLQSLPVQDAHGIGEAMCGMPKSAILLGKHIYVMISTWCGWLWDIDQTAKRGDHQLQSFGG